MKATKRLPSGLRRSFQLAVLVLLINFSIASTKTMLSVHFASSLMRKSLMFCIVRILGLSHLPSSASSITFLLLLKHMILNLSSLLLSWRSSICGERTSISGRSTSPLTSGILLENKQCLDGTTLCWGDGVHLGGNIRMTTTSPPAA